MEQYNELAVVNGMLGTLGENPVASLTDTHTLLPSGRLLLDTVSQREQGKGWWFNQEEFTASPDVDGNMMVPQDALSVDPLDPGLPYIQRGRRLYDPKRGTYDFTGYGPVVCELVRFVPFDDLPPTAKSFIGATAIYEFQALYDADTTKSSQLIRIRDAAFIAMNKEHIRYMKANLLTNGSMARRQLHLGLPVSGPLVRL